MTTLGNIATAIIALRDGPPSLLGPAYSRLEQSSDPNAREACRIIRNATRLAFRARRAEDEGNRAESDRLEAEFASWLERLGDLAIELGTGDEER